MGKILPAGQIPVSNPGLTSTFTAGLAWTGRANNPKRSTVRASDSIIILLLERNSMENH